MDQSKRIVVSLRLEDLWNSEGAVRARKRRELSVGDLADLLREGPLRFVVADVGHPLMWIPETDRFTFWKAEVKQHVADPEADGFYLDDFHGHYAYVASEWSADPGPPIVLLEKHH